MKKRRTKVKKTAKTTAPNRTYKARIFEMVFSDKKEFFQSVICCMLQIFMRTLQKTTICTEQGRS